MGAKKKTRKETRYNNNNIIIYNIIEQLYTSSSHHRYCIIILSYSAERCKSSLRYIYAIISLTTVSHFLVTSILLYCHTSSTGRGRLRAVKNGFFMRKNEPSPGKIKTLVRYTIFINVYNVYRT